MKDEINISFQFVMASYLTTNRSKDFSQQLSNFAFFEWKMSLSIEDSKDDVTKTRNSDAASKCFGSVTTSKVNQMESRSSSMKNILMDI